MSYCQRCADVERENEELRKALLAHRADLHNYSSRPCQTCRNSAAVLHLRVPNCCAKAETDGTSLDLQGNVTASPALRVGRATPGGDVRP